MLYYSITQTKEENMSEKTTEQKNQNLKNAVKGLEKVVSQSGFNIKTFTCPTCQKTVSVYGHSCKK